LISRDGEVKGEVERTERRAEYCERREGVRGGSGRSRKEEGEKSRVGREEALWGRKSR